MTEKEKSLEQITSLLQKLNDLNTLEQIRYRVSKRINEIRYLDITKDGLRVSVKYNGMKLRGTIIKYLRNLQMFRIRLDTTEIIEVKPKDIIKEDARKMST